MDRLYTSPTLGDVVKYLVDASGIMPRKARDRSDETEFDEVMAKTYQKRMQRLAREDCDLQRTMDEILLLHADTLSRYIRCPFRATQMSELLNDLFESYTTMIKTQGTFMTKANTVRYFLTTHGVDVAVRSLARDWIRFQGYIYASAQPPQPFWFLPTESGEGLVTALDKVLAWAYTSCGKSLATFHYPIGVDDPAHKLKRNEKAARSWTSAKRPPSLPVLVKNLDESFEAQAAEGKPVNPELQNAIVTCATIARMTTCIALDIRDAFGHEYLREVIGQIQLYASWISTEIDEYIVNLADEVLKQDPDSKPETRVNLGIKMAPDFWAFFESKRTMAKELQRPHMDGKGGVPPPVIEWTEARYGAYAARLHLDIISRWQLGKPANLDTYVENALAIKKNPQATLNDVSRFCDRPDSAEVAERLPWIAHWLRGVACYRTGDYEAASTHYVRAFEHAKYSAGEMQYLLVNQYLEVMAKNKRWLPFKQGAQWACFLGISIRYLRDKEPTEENMRNAFGILGLTQMQYTSL